MLQLVAENLARVFPSYSDKLKHIAHLQAALPDCNRSELKLHHEFNTTTLKAKARQAAALQGVDCDHDD